MTPYGPLANARLDDGVWRFNVPGTVSVPLAGRFGDKAFIGHYHMLSQMYLGREPEDGRSVYFVGWENGPIKIGVAINVATRLRFLQIGCPYDVQLWATASGGRRTEKDYHRRFAVHRLRGEWFERCPEIEEEIARLSSQGISHE